MTTGEPAKTASRVKRIPPFLIAAAVLLLLVLATFIWRGGHPGGERAPETIGFPPAPPSPAPAAGPVPRVEAGRTAADGSLPRSPHLVASFELSYGSGPGEVGIIDEPEQDIAGAESFAVAAGGVFLVMDTVNQRILRADAEGGRVVEIQLPDDAVAADIAVDARGRMLLYDYAGRIDWYDENGERRGSLPVDMERWEVRTGLRAVGDFLLMSDVDQRDHLLAILEPEGPRAPRPEELAEWNGEGFLAESGTRYTAGLERWERGWVTAAGPDGAPNRWEVDAPGIVSLRMLGEDGGGNPHFQVERVENGRVVLEVHRFNPAGERTGLLRLPQNDYHHWTIWLLSIDDSGRVYQALPRQDRFVLNAFVF